jgi:hypothetical protein
MKNLKLLVLLSATLLITSCSKDSYSLDMEIPCEGECLFSVNNFEGTVTFMSCFGEYGIQAKYPDDSRKTMYAIPMSPMKKKYQEEGLEVKFSAAFVTNTREPFFPDPNIDMNYLFEINLVAIE